MKRTYSKLAAFLGCSCLIALLAPLTLSGYADELPAEPAAASEAANDEAVQETETVYISTADDLIQLSENCRYDAWSRNKQVILLNDISLGGIDNFMIPTFGGSFDGGGHKIREFSITAPKSPAGFFGVVQSGAVITGLTVEGSVTPSGSTENTGGIAGICEGTIRDCAFYGTVSGDRCVGGIAGQNTISGRIASCISGGGVFGSRMTGGIAGSSHGSISFCSGSAYVNTVSIDPGLSLSDLHLDLNVFADVSRLMSLDTVNIASDTGGIAGFSDGAVIGCINSGTIGYQHIGYNVGGITGRNRGLISGARNNGTVYGRKDVGGIAGMAEPFVSVDLTEDQLTVIQNELQSLNEMVARAAEDADRTSASVNARMNQLTDQVNAAVNNADDLSGKLKDYTNSTVDEADRGGELLDDSISGLSDASFSLEDGTEKLSDSTTGIREAIREVQTDTQDAHTLEELNKALDSAGKAAEIEAAGKAKIREGEELLKSIDRTSDPADLRLQKLRDGAALMKEGADILRNGRGEGSADAGGPVFYMNDALTHLSGTDLKLNENALKDAERSSKSLRDGIDDINAGLSEISQTLSYLNGEDPLYFSPMGPEVSDSADALYSSMQQISDSLKEMSGSTDQDTRTLTGDLREINDQFRKVTDLVIGQVSDAENSEPGDIIEDTSVDIDPEDITNGKLILCRNSGPVSGDLNAGGICGSMSIFDELDPENDSGSSLSSIYHKRYELRCLVLQCTNSGEVIAKRSSAGGICGFGKLGLISDCISDSPVSSEDGDYIGGICGLTDNVIRHCYAKNRLSGREYVGGIAGGAFSEQEKSGTNDSSALIEDCTAIPLILKAKQHAGAIAGADRGVILRNRFVSDMLGGINGMSIRGKAEPADYADLAASDPFFPLELKEFRLDFTADGNVVKTVRFHYGDSFSKEMLPAIPEREGYYSRWDLENSGLSVPDSADGQLGCLYNDTVVNAVYSPYVTALKSAATRSYSRPVFFAQGDFDDRAVLKADPAVVSFCHEPGGIFETLKSYNREILEQWHLELPAEASGKQETCTVRYLLPAAAGSRNDLYLRPGSDESEPWQKIEPRREGSYLCFEVPGNEAYITVLSAKTPWWIPLVTGGIVFCIVVLVFRDIYVRLTVKEGQESKKTKNKPPLRTRLRRHAIALLALLLALIGSTALIIHKAPGVADGMGLYLMLRNYFERSDIEMDLEISADLGEENYLTDVSMYTAASGNRKVTAVDWQGITVYYCDQMMIFENGRAFRIDADLPDYSDIIRMALPLYRSVKISSSELNGVRSFHADAVNEDARKLLRLLVPFLSDRLPDTLKVDADLVMTDADLSSIGFHWNGAIQPDISGSDQAGPIPSEITAAMHFHSASEPHQIPQIVESAIRSQNAADIPDLSDDFKRLFTAFTDLYARDPLEAEANVQASCGPFVVNDSFYYQKSSRYGKDISRISRTKEEGSESHDALYITKDRVLTESGVSAGLSGGYLEDTGKLIGMASAACMNGELSHNESDGLHSYTVSLDEEAIAELTSMVVPEAASLPLKVNEGSVTVMIREDALRKGALSSGGKSPIEAIVLKAEGETDAGILSVPVSMSVRLDFIKGETEFEVPDTVLKQLGVEAADPG